MTISIIKLVGHDENDSMGETTMNTKLLQLIGATALLFSTSGVAQAATVGFSPDPANVNVGETFTVDIVGIGFTELSGGTFDIGFDSTHLLFNSVSIDPYFDFLPEPGGPAAGDVWPGVGFDVFANAPAVGDFVIATISLTVLRNGTSHLDILNSESFSTTELLNPMFRQGIVTTIPVPAAVWLFGSGLLGLFGVARRKTA